MTAEAPTPLTAREKRRLDQRFAVFRQKLELVGKLRPREDYLYPIVKSVPFSDTETALEMAIVSFGEKVETILQKQKSGRASR